jgi:hypothetical protein
MHFTPDGQFQYRILYSENEFAIEITNSENKVLGPFSMKACGQMDIYEFHRNGKRHTVYFFM